MSLFAAFGQKGLAALASTLENTFENIGNIVAPPPDDEDSNRQRRVEGNDDQDEDEDTFESRIHNFINSKRLVIDNPPSVDPQQSPNGSLIDIDLNDDDSDVSSIDNSFQNYSKQKEMVQSPSSTSSASSGVFLSNNELEKRVQLKYRESLEAEISSFNTKLRETEIRYQQNMSRIQHDCDYWKDVSEAQRSEISKLKAILEEPPASPTPDSSELMVQYEDSERANEQLRSQLARSASEFNQLSAEYADLKAQQNQLLIDADSWKSQLSQLQQEHSEVVAQFTALQQTVGTSQNGDESESNSEALFELKALVEAKSKEVNQLQASVQDAIRHRNDTAAQLKEEQDAVQSLKGQLTQLQAELTAKEQQLNSETARWNDVLTQSENALKDAETVAWTAKAETSEILFAMQLAEGKVTELQQQLEVLRAENGSLKSRNSQEVDDVLAREHTASGELKDLQQIAGHLQQQLSESQAEVVRITSLAREREKDFHSAEQEVRSLSAELKNATKGLSEAELTIATLKAEVHTTLASSESERQEQNQIIATLNEEITAVKADRVQLAEGTEKRSREEAQERTALGEDLKQKQADVVNLQNKTTELTAQLTAAQSVLSEDAETLNQTMEQGRRREAELEQLVGQLKASVEEQAQTIAGLQSITAQQQSSGNSQIELLNQELESAKRQMDVLQSELTSVKEKCQGLAKSLEDCTAAQHKAEQQLSHQAADSKNVLLALKKEVDKCQDLQSQNASLREQLSAAQSGVSADAEKMTAELQKARQVQAELEQRLNALTASNDELKSSNEQLHAESTAHQAEVGVLKTQLGSVKEEILSLTVNLENSKAAHHAADQKCHHLETESHNVLLALKKEVEKCQELQNQNHDLKEQATHAGVAAATAAAAVTASQVTPPAPVVVEDTAKLAGLQSQLDSLHAELQRVATLLSEETTKVTQYAAQTEQKTKQVEDLTKQLQEQTRFSEMSLKSAAEAKTAVEAELTAIRSSGADMNSQVGGLKQQITKLETENRQLHQVIAQLRQVRKTNKGEEENLQVERDELRTQNTNLQAEVARLDKLASASANNAEQIVKFRAELSAALNKALYLEQALDETKKQLATVERDHYNKESQLDIVSSDLMLVKQDLELSQLEVRNLKDAMSLIQVEQENESSRLQQQLEMRTKQLHSQFDQKQKELLSEYASKYDECLQRCHVAEQQCQDEQLFRRRAELDFNNEKKKVQKTLESALQQLNNTQQDVVDRMLISNLIVSYFKRRRSMEVMELIAKVLQFNEEQKVVVGLRVAPVNLISSIFATVIGSGASSAAVTATDVEGDNLAEQWINFLITEAENGKGPPK